MNAEHLKFLISRFDGHYESVNTKGSFYIGLNTFILGGICAGFIALESKINYTTTFWIFLGLVSVLCFLSIVFTLSAISPFLRDNENNEKIPSLIFFGGISRYNLNTFLSKLKLQTEDNILEDMSRQVHCLANGLKRKYRKLQIVSYLLLGQFITVLLFFIYIISNYKK